MCGNHEDGLTYVKRFSFGGTLLNREYLCAPPRSHIELFSADDPGLLYARLSPVSAGVA